MRLISGEEQPELVEVEKFQEAEVVKSLFIVYKSASTLLIICRRVGSNFYLYKVAPLLLLTLKRLLSLFRVHVKMLRWLRSFYGFS